MYLCVEVMVRKKISPSQGVFLNNISNVVLTACYCGVHEEIVTGMVPDVFYYYFNQWKCRPSFIYDVALRYEKGVGRIYWSGICISVIKENEKVFRFTYSISNQVII